MRPLVAEDFSQVHTTISKGFSTDTFKLDIPPNDLQERLIQSGYDPCLSIGAFVDGSMIGVWLTGARVIDGARMAYACGTAVLHEWRTKGIAQRMLELVDDICERTKTVKYILTTFQDNKAAINLYANNGYRISRPLVTYKMNRFPNQGESHFRVEDVPLDSALELMDKMLGYAPTWRNSVRSLEAVKTMLNAAVVKSTDGHPVAYGIYQPATTSLLQIGVDTMIQPAESETVRLLLSHFHRLHPDKPSMQFVEVPSDAIRIISLLKEAGFEYVQDLVEMIKEY